MAGRPSSAPSASIFVKTMMDSDGGQGAGDRRAVDKHPKINGTEQRADDREKMTDY
jgi:hypothetical protein